MLDMSIYPDRKNDPRKEVILSRSPYLRTMLDSEAKHKNPEQWYEKMKIHRNKLEEDMNNRLGNNWNRLTVMPLFLYGKVAGIFNPLLSREMQFAAATSIIMAGFEVANQDDVTGVLFDLVKKFREEDLFNPICLTDLQESQKAVDYIYALAETGAYMATTKSEDDKRTDPLGSESPFNKFISGLDLENL